MTDILKDEISKINAREVSSQFELDTMKEIYLWASNVFGEVSFSMEFSTLCKLFWKEYFKDAGAIRAIRGE